MDCSMPGFPDLHYLPEFAQTHVHWVGDAIQPSHPLSPPFPPVFNLSQHQGLFQWVGSLNQVAKGLGASVSVLPMNIQGWFPLGWLVRFPCSPQDSQESSPAPQFESISSLALSLLYIHTWLLVKSLFAMQEIRFHLRVGKSPWRRKRQPSPVFLPDPGKRNSWENSREFRTEEPGGLQSMGSQRIGHGWVTNTFT